MHESAPLPILEATIIIVTLALIIFSSNRIVELRRSANNLSDMIEAANDRNSDLCFIKYHTSESMFASIIKTLTRAHRELERDERYFNWSFRVISIGAAVIIGVSLAGHDVLWPLAAIGTLALIWSILLLRRFFIHNQAANIIVEGLETIEDMIRKQ